MVTTTFGYTGAYQVFNVPANLSGQIVATVKGGAGGGFDATQQGNGEIVQGTLPVVPGDVLYIYCGGLGAAPTSSKTVGGVGGWNGGGVGGTSAGGLAGYGGGGATDIRLNGTAIGNRLVIAGGGGGGSGDETTDGGDAYSPNAGGGETGFHGGGGGGGGTQTAGGTHGAPYGTASDSALDGGLSNGGRGSQHSAAGSIAGGGGGGGLWGGGGGGGTSDSGGLAGGGGGGSGTTGGLDPSKAISTTQGAWTAAGQVILTYILNPNAPAITSPPNAGNVDVSGLIDLSWLFSGADPSDYQASADIQWRVGAGAWNSLPSAVTTASYYLFAAHAFDAYVDQAVEVQVRTTDNHGGVSPWSASSYFYPRTKPAAPFVFATLPLHVDAIVTTSDTFRYWQGRVTADVSGSAGAVLATGAISGPATATSYIEEDPVPSYALTHDVVYHVQYRRATYDGVYSDWGDSGPVTAFGPPPPSPAVLLTTYPAQALITIQIQNLAFGAMYPAVKNKIYRTIAGGTEHLIADDVSVDSTFSDWEAPLNIQVQYRIVAVSAEGGQASAYTG